MALTVESFQTLIQHKLFVSIESASDSVIFTNPNENSIGDRCRKIATNANIIVFLPLIRKIWARGAYYGISSEEVNEIESQLNSLYDLVNGENGLCDSVVALTELVQSQGTLIGSNLDSEQQAIITNANGIIGEIVDLRASIAAVTPGGVDLATLVDNAIDDALTNQLESKLGSSQTITNIINNISDINTTLSEKAELEAFNDLVKKLGVQDWVWVEPTEQNPNPRNTTIVQKLNTLSDEISLIPHFSIQVVDRDPITKLPDINGEISKTTIYLVRSEEGFDANNNEIFTEYVYVNLDANKYDMSDPENPVALPERWGWETLGRQYFNVTNFVQMDQQDFENLKTQILSDITAIQTQLGDGDIQQIAVNKSNITNLQSSVSALENLLLDEHGNFKLTGSSIYTNDSKISYIADDIASLENNKMDKNSLSWVIIGESQQNEEP